MNTQIIISQFSPAMKMSTYWALALTLGLVIAFFALTFTHDGVLVRATLLGGVLVIFAACLWSIFQSPKGVLKNDEGITIYFMLSTKHIPAAEIESIKYYSSGIQATRVIGAGNFFGDLGLYSNSEIGTFKAYITNPSEVSVIFIKGKKPIAVSGKLTE